MKLLIINTKQPEVRDGSPVKRQDVSQLAAVVPNQ